MQRRLLLALRGPFGAAIVGAIVVLALAVALRPITPRITFNSGLGYDGQYYAAMVGAMRGDTTGPVLAERPHYAYRPLPAAIVAASGLPVIQGFLLMNLVSLALGGAFLAATVRRYTGGVFLPMVAVLWWAALPGALRYVLYYPVLVDGIGLLMLFALLYAVVARAPLLFVVLIGPAMLIRENLIVLVPLLWLALRRDGMGRATAWTAVAAVVALAAYAWVRIAPPVPAAQPFDPIVEARQNIEWLLGNANDRAVRAAASWVLALGLFAAAALAAGRAGVTFLRREPIWAAYLAITVLLIAVIGGDYDRYFLYLVPALAVVAFGVTLRRRSALSIAALTGAHLLVARFAWPVGRDEPGYLAYNVATMDVRALAALAAWAAALAVAATAILILTKKRDAPAEGGVYASGGGG